jgi:hypothetical protein
VLRQACGYGLANAGHDTRAAGEPLREISLSYTVDHSTISRLKARHAAEV